MRQEVKGQVEGQGQDDDDVSHAVDEDGEEEGEGEGAGWVTCFCPCSCDGVETYVGEVAGGDGSYHLHRYIDGFMNEWTEPLS